MDDWLLESFQLQLRLDLYALTRKELDKLTKDQLIDLIINNFDLMRKPENCDEK